MVLKLKFPSPSFMISQLIGHRYIPKWPVITALILFLTSRRFHAAPRFFWVGRPRRKRIYYLPKTLFKEDLSEVFRENDEDFELWYVSRQPLARLAELFLPNYISEYDYTNISDDVLARKEALREHWTSALSIFSRLSKPSAFLTCAFNYRDQREFASACIANGIPFVALHKECITTPITRIARENVYRDLVGPFTGTRITAYNEDERATMIAAGVAEPEIIDVVGCPRVDPFIRRRAEKSTTRAFDVVFFSFSKTTYLPVYRRVPKWPNSAGGLKIEPWDWSQLYLRFHLFTIEFASDHPELRVALKVKTGFNVLDILELVRLREQPLPPNLQIINMGEGGTLAATAKVVCGFNSTVLLEAIASCTPVIIPTFAEAERGSAAEKYGMLRLGNAVHYADSEVELARLLELQSRFLPERDRAYTDDERLVLERYVGFADGKSGERMRSSIAKVVRA